MNAPALTQRQREVLELVAQGYSNRRIAEHLFLSVNTVATHLRVTSERLHARDRAHAVALGYQLGLLPLPSVIPDRRAAELERLAQALTVALVENAALRREVRLADGMVA